jgi:Trp operon repressor
MNETEYISTKPNIISQLLEKYVCKRELSKDLKMRRDNL